jgi:hypothetical protein
VLEERYKATGYQVCTELSRTISERGQLRKCSRKSSQWDLYPETDWVTSVRWAQLRIFFAKKERSHKARNVLCNVWFLPSEPEHYPSHPARARADLCRGAWTTCCACYLGTVPRPWSSASSFEAPSCKYDSTLHYGTTISFHIARSQSTCCSPLHDVFSGHNVVKWREKAPIFIARQN